MKEKKHKILVDLTFIRLERPFFSLAIYAYRLLNAIEESQRSKYILLATRNNVDIIRKKVSGYDIKVWKRNPILNRVLRLFPSLKENYVEWSFRRAFERGEHDTVFIVSDGEPYTDLVIRGKRKVVVIHDQKGTEFYSSNEMNQFCTAFDYRKLLSSDRIIAISNYTKNEIVRIHKINPENIDVVYNGVKVAEYSIKPKQRLPQHYILYVNTLHPYKNAITLLQAFIILKDKIKEDLVFVGKQTDYWDDVLFPLIQQEDLTNRVYLLQNLSDEELRYCYENATVFVTTSHYEGFGYTPIEAAICECPVISCTCTALPEVTDGKVFYYDPVDDCNSLATKIIDVIRNRQSVDCKTLSMYFANKYSETNQVNQIEQILFK